MTALAYEPVPLEATAPRVRGAWGVVAGLGVLHMLVDATSILAAMRVAMPLMDSDQRQAMWVVAIYNLLAFATQPIMGAAVDCLRIAAPAAAAGALMAVAAALGAEQAPMRAVAAALGADQAPMAALWLAGLGNSLFHVGAGAVVLRLARGRTAMPGVFVGPGDMGVVLGFLIGQGIWTGGQWIIAACAVGTVFAAMLFRLPTEKTQRQQGGVTAPAARRPWLAAALVLLCFAVAVRSYIGGVVSSPYTDDAPTVWLGIYAPIVWLGIYIAAMVAKCVAGFLADRIGWIMSTVPCVLVAAPIIAFSRLEPRGAIAAQFLVQAAMPVTLAATARILPRWPGLAFGIASLSITLGTLPFKLSWIPLSTDVALLLLQVACAMAILGALLIGRFNGPQPTASAATTRQ